jgi:hypothetical protein
VLRATKARTLLPLNVPLGAWIGSRHRSQCTWNSYVSPDNTILYQGHIVGSGLHSNSIEGTFRHRRFHLNCFSALPDLFSVPCIIPVSVNTTTCSLETSKLPRPATVIDVSVITVHPTITDTIYEYIDTLDTWKRPLLEHLECISDKQRLHEILSSGDSIKFTLASDGGARHNLGSFGWELAIDREILWQCKGPAFGLRPGSFRAESYGFISALLFLQAYIQHFNTTIDPTVPHDFFCDSESLLKRIQRGLHRSWVNPSHCLASDFDLENGILNIITTLSISFKYSHIKSHQDDNIEVHLPVLPWAAQMNAHIDSLATDYLDNYSA